MTIRPIQGNHAMTRYAPLRHRTPSAAHAQRGSALFIAMMLLIILSLLALSAATVTAMQERMASTYRAEHRAFEHAEARLRAAEKEIATNPDPCHAADAYPGAEWMATPPADGAQTYRNMSRGNGSLGFGWRGSSKAGQPALVGDIQCAYFRVAAVDNDTPGPDATSTAIVTSVYVP